PTSRLCMGFEVRDDSPKCSLVNESAHRFFVQQEFDQSAHELVLTQEAGKSVPVRHGVVRHSPTHIFIGSKPQTPKVVTGKVYGLAQIYLEISRQDRICNRPRDHVEMTRPDSRWSRARELGRERLKE